MAATTVAPGGRHLCPPDEGPNTELASKLSSLDENLQAWYTNPAPVGDADAPLAQGAAAHPGDGGPRRAEARALPGRATRLYYEILCDFDVGTEMFLRTFQQAKEDHDVLFQELLAYEMQRFLPGGADPFNDVIKQEVERFRTGCCPRMATPGISPSPSPSLIT